jgi:transglutaminase-like putative cysteine protease
MMLAPAPTLSGTITQIADGVAGVDQTIRTMRELVNNCKTDLRIREAATSVIFIQPEKVAHYEIEALFNFVRDSIRYVRDVHGVETLMAPPTTLAVRLGDCDDQACLLACMLESVGYPSRFVVAGYDAGVFEHVYLQAWDGSQWIDLDPTEPQPMGWAPPDPSVIAFEAV